MNLETLTIAVVLAAAALPCAWFAMGGRGWLARTIVVLGALALSAVFAWGTTALEHRKAPAPSPDHRPLELGADGYVSSQQCRACHPQAYATWSNSYHRRMTTAATPQNMLAPFDHQTIHDDLGHAYQLEQRDDEFWVQMDDPEHHDAAGPAPRVWRQIVQITGSHHFQFLWYATGHERELGILHVCYRLLDQARWMPLDGCCIFPPRKSYDIGIGRWGLVCIKCHATHGRPRLGPNHLMDTQVAELGIACESCHGPGEEHVRVNHDPRRRYDLHLSKTADSSIVLPTRLSHERASLVCAHCHGVTLFRDEAKQQDWNLHGYRFRPGGDWSDDRELKRTGADKFWSDGMIRVSGREYNGLVRSPCYLKGEMSCLSCHVLHQPEGDPRPAKEWANDQLKLGMDSNGACLPCHEQYRDEARLTAHTHHKAGSTGSDCYNCHMPYTTYGLLKAIRTHEVHSPSAKATLETGRPNGCNQCHLDKTLGWTADHLSEWYGIAKPALPEEQRTIAASVLWALEGDAGQRALAAWSMGWDAARQISGHDWMVPYLAQLMEDDYRAVRYIAHRSLREDRALSDFGYDFAGPPEQRNAAALAISNAWSRSAHVRAVAPALLIGESGTVDQGKMRDLLKHRDTRDITLNE
jgi:Cytochrome c554 and c-prime